MRAPLSIPKGTDAQRARTWLGELAAVAAVLLVPTAYYVARLGRLFPLIEYRSWLDYPSIGLPRLLQVMLVRDDLFSRWLSLEFVKSMKGVCGIDVSCLDTVSYVPVALACVLLYAFARRIGLARAVAAGVTLVWAFSAPVADAMAWQATSHDRLAALFSFAALGVAYHELGKPWSWARAAVSNAGLFVIVVLAYNSKESSFFLGPSLATLPLAVHDFRNGKAWLRGLSLVVAPVAYAVFHNVRYVELLARDPVWQGHTGGGDPIYNLKTLTPFLVNSEDWTLATVATFSLIVLGAILPSIHAFRRIRRGEASGVADRAAARTMLWLWFAFFVAGSAALRTRFASTYYLMLPAALFYLAATLGLVRAARILPARLRSIFAAVVGFVCAACLLPGFLRTNAVLAAESAHSDAFRASFPTLRRYIPPSHAGPVYLVTDDARPDAYRFVGQPRQRDLYKYVYRSPRPNPAFEEQFFDLKTSAWRRSWPRDENALYVVFDESMRLVRIDVGSRNWFTTEPALGAPAARAPE